MSPSVRERESEDDYVSRCIPIVLHEGTAKDGAQAAAICHSMFRESKKAKEDGEFLNRFELVKRAKMALASGDDVQALAKQEEFDDEEECVKFMMDEKGMEEDEAMAACERMMGKSRKQLPEEAEKSWRAMQTDPGQYKRIRYGKDEFGDGISAVWGVKRVSNKDVVELQSIVFDDKQFTKAEAVAWLKKHDRKTSIEATGEAGEKEESMFTPTSMRRDVPDPSANLSTTLDGRRGAIAGHYQEPDKIEVQRPNQFSELDDI